MVAPSALSGRKIVVNFVAELLRARMRPDASASAVHASRLGFGALREHARLPSGLRGRVPVHAV